MLESEEKNFLRYLNNRFIDSSDQKLLCCISTTDRQRGEYLKNKYPDYQFLLQVERDVHTGKVVREHVINLLKKLDYIDDMYPCSDRAILILNSKYGNNFKISCPLMKTKDGKLKPLYQLENFDWY